MPDFTPDNNDPSQSEGSKSLSEARGAPHRSTDAVFAEEFYKAFNVVLAKFQIHTLETRLTEGEMRNKGAGDTDTKDAETPSHEEDQRPTSSSGKLSQKDETPTLETFTTGGIEAETVSDLVEPDDPDETLSDLEPEEESFLQLVKLQIEPQAIICCSVPHCKVHKHGGYVGEIQDIHEVTEISDAVPTPVEDQDDPKEEDFHQVDISLPTTSASSLSSYSSESTTVSSYSDSESSSGVPEEEGEIVETESKHVQCEPELFPPPGPEPLDEDSNDIRLLEQCDEDDDTHTKLGASWIPRLELIEDEDHQQQEERLEDIEVIEVIRVADEGWGDLVQIISTVKGSRSKVDLHETPELILPPPPSDSECEEDSSSSTTLTEELPVAFLEEPFFQMSDLPKEAMWYFTTTATIASAFALGRTEPVAAALANSGGAVMPLIVPLGSPTTSDPKPIPEKKEEFSYEEGLWPESSQTFQKRQHSKEVEALLRDGSSLRMQNPIATTTSKVFKLLTSPFRYVYNAMFRKPRAK